jgi:hypothetical protein
MFSDESEQIPLEIENLKLQIETFLGFPIELIKDEDGAEYEFVLPNVGDKQFEIITMIDSVQRQLEEKYNFPCYITLVINTQESSSKQFN